MEENESLDEFFNLFCSSLHKVEAEYFFAKYEVEHIEGLRALGEVKDGNFYRYGERIFCYELYHQLRKQFEDKKQSLKKENDIDFMPNVIIQAEVKKIKLQEFVDRFGFVALSNSFIPDLLVHTPTNIDFHAFVIEVKVQPSISKEDVWFDIKKISEFFERYEYKRGIFLAANANPDDLSTIISELTQGTQITFYVKNKDNGKTEKVKSKVKIDNLHRYNDIKILAMPEPKKDLLVWSWENNNWE